MAPDVPVPPVVAAILARRSVSPRRLIAPAPDPAQVGLMVQAAAAAPDHGRLRPWRFVWVPDDRRDALAETFAKAAREADPGIGTQLIEKERSKAYNAPCLIAVVARIDVDDAVVHATEQWVSVGAAIQNLLLAAEGFGYRAMIVSGRKVGTGSMRGAFRLVDEEHLVGFVAVGTPSGPLPPRERPQPFDLLEIWQGEPD